MILNRDPDDKEPKRLVFENCTFNERDFPSMGPPKWLCSCGHLSWLEHETDIGGSCEVRHAATPDTR